MKPEQVLHYAVASYLDLALKPPIFWSTFPAGGGGKARGGQLKRMGLKAGVPDIMIIAQGRCLFIELKSPRGRMSLEQIYMHKAIIEAGGVATICRSVDDVQRAVRAWGII